MPRCPSCKVELLIERPFQQSAYVCSRCYCVGFTRTGLESLAQQDFVRTLENALAHLKTAHGNPYVLHVSTPPGPASKAFARINQRRLMVEREAKDFSR